MILRILEEGQFEVPDGALDELNQLDDNLVVAVEKGDEEGFRSALGDLLARARELGTPVPDDYLGPSDVFLPAAESTIDEVRRHLEGEDEGFIPD